MSNPASSRMERAESSDSPLLLEDCFMMSLPDSHLETETEPLLSTNTPSLFNEPDDNKFSFDDKGMASPTLSTTSSNDGLPVSEDSWSLLQAFEAITKPDQASTSNSCQIINTDLILEELPEEFVLPEFTQIDDLLMLTNNELSKDESTLSDDGTTSVDTSTQNNDPPHSDSGKSEASTSDMLANLISHTLLMDPSLGGLLSSTTLDLSAVFGSYVQTCASLGTPNDNSASEDRLSPSQEVPEIQMTSIETKSHKRSAALSSCESVSGAENEEPKCKRKKSGEEKYIEMRQKNNEASRRSRLMRKQKHQTLEQQAIQLEEDNKALKEKAEQLEKTVKTLKAFLVRHILDLKKEK